MKLRQDIMASFWDQNILDGDFRILTPLGEGSFGEVKLACHIPTKTQVAVKILRKKSNALVEIKSEVKILQSLEHSKIIHFFHVIDTRSRTYIVMEYVTGAHLEMILSEIGYLKEQDARHIFQQVVSAVHYLHQRHIAHRDIKLENILIDGDGNVKLCDFGMAIQVSEGQMLKKVCGSLLYMAPEILASKPYDGLAVDMWSLGVLLYVLVTGQFPYKATTFCGMHRLITNTQYPIPYHLSKPCYTIIAQLLTVPTQQRITICQLLKSQWMGHIKNHTGPTTKEILPKLIETMCAMGYNLEEILSSLRQRKPNKVTATFNILKHKMSCEDSFQETVHPCIQSSHVGAHHPFFHLKRSASEPALPKIRKGRKSQSKEEGVKERHKRCQSYTKLVKNSFLKQNPCSDETVLKGGVPMANDFKNTTVDIVYNMNSVDSLPGDLPVCESTLHGRPTWVLNIDFSKKEPSIEPNIPHDQTQIGSTSSASRPFKAWKRLRKRVSHGLRALFICVMPIPQ